MQILGRENVIPQGRVPSIFRWYALNTIYGAFTKKLGRSHLTPPFYT
jgi:hypothetical protein